jgi:hypothetical protein
MSKLYADHGQMAKVREHVSAALFWLVTGLILSFSLSAFSYADGLEGTWRLTMRKLPDGTVLTPPTVQGLVNINKGVEQTLVFWRTPDGKSASLSQIDKIDVSETEIIATPVLVIFDDGSGKPPVYMEGGETKRSPLTKQAGRVSYQHPTHPPFVVLEGNKFTATLKDVFVDYWEKLQ